MLAFNLSAPFPAVVIDQFLPAALLQDVLAQAWTKRREAELHPAGYRFESFVHADLIRYLYRFVVKGDLNQWLEGGYGWSDVYRLPQLYRIQGPWTGLKAHTDNQPGRDLAMIIYMSSGWQPGFGGELHLLESTDQGLKTVQTVEPLQNRAVFFPLGPGSWHAVAPLTHDWERMTLIQDWPRRI